MIFGDPGDLDGFERQVVVTLWDNFDENSKELTLRQISQGVDSSGEADEVLAGLTQMEKRGVVFSRSHSSNGETGQFYYSLTKRGELIATKIAECE